MTPHETSDCNGNALASFAAALGSARIKTYALSFNHRGQPIGLSHRELICNVTDKVLKRTRLSGVLLNWARRNGYRVESKETWARYSPNDGTQP